MVKTHTANHHWFDFMGTFIFLSQVCIHTVNYQTDFFLIESHNNERPVESFGILTFLGKYRRAQSRGFKLEIQTAAHASVLL